MKNSDLVKIIGLYDKLNSKDKAYILGVICGFTMAQEQTKSKEKEIKTKKEKGA